MWPKQQDTRQLRWDTAQPLSHGIPTKFPASPQGLMHHTQGSCTGCLGSALSLAYILT